MSVPRRLPVLLLMLLLSAVCPALAQGAAEGDEEEGSKTTFLFELGSWNSQPKGLELEPATKIDPANPFGTTPLAFDPGTETELYVKFDLEMPKNMGGFSVWFYDHEQNNLALSKSSPGIFQWGESLVHPLFAGVNLNGRADAFDADASFSLSDFRLDYSRAAFENPRINGRWFVGWRRVKHNRGMNAAYSALVPGLTVLLPPLTSPIPGLDPKADTATIYSGFEGRGPEAGFEIEVPFLKNRLKLEAGMALAGLRGDMDIQYASNTHYYVLAPANGTETLLGPPYSEFGQSVTNPVDGTITALAASIAQRDFKIGIVDDGRQSSAGVLDVWLGLRGRVWKTLEVVAGYKSIRYDDVIADVRPKVTVSPLGITISAGELVGVNVQDVSEVKRSVTYEGFYYGLAYTF